MTLLIATIRETLHDIHQLLGLNILFWGVFTIASALLLRKDIRMNEVHALAPSSWIAALLGALFLALLSPKFLLIVVIIFVGYFLLEHRGYRLKVPWFTQYLGARTVGAISGFLQGGGARGSDIRTAYLLSRGYTLAETGAISSVVGIGNGLLGTLVFLITGRLDITSNGNVLVALIIVVLALFYAMLRAKLFHNSRVIAHTHMITTIVLVLLFGALLWRLFTL